MFSQQKKHRDTYFKIDESVNPRENDWNLRREFVLARKIASKWNWTDFDEYEDKRHFLLKLANKYEELFCTERTNFGKKQLNKY